MEEKEQQFKEDRRTDMARRTVSGRRQSIILHHGLLKFDGTTTSSISVLS